MAQFLLFLESALSCYYYPLTDNMEANNLCRLFRYFIVILTIASICETRKHKLKLKVRVHFMCTLSRYQCWQKLMKSKMIWSSEQSSCNFFITIFPLSYIMGLYNTVIKRYGSPPATVLRTHRAHSFFMNMESLLSVVRIDYPIANS